MTYLTPWGVGFCWCVRTPRLEGEDQRRRERSLVPAADQTDHVWT